MSEAEPTDDQGVKKEESGAAEAAGSGEGVAAGATKAETEPRKRLTSGLDVFDELPAKAQRPSVAPPNSGAPRPPPPPGAVAIVVPPAAQAVVSPAGEQGPDASAAALTTGPSSAKAPPPPPSKAGPAPAAADVEPDWDDEDEDTAALARGRLKASAPLTADPPQATPRSVQAPPSARPRVAAPPPSIRPPPVSMKPESVLTPPPPSVSPYSGMPSSMPQSVPPPSGVPASYVQAPPRSNAASLALGAVVILALVGVIVFLLLPRTGSLMITVAGADNRPIDKVEILVNGQQRCTASPCRVEGLDPGTHIVSASAPGRGTTPPHAVAVRSGSESVTNLTLGGSGGGPVGLEITVGEAKGVRVFVDGQDRGAPPVTLSDLTPGEHVIRIEGNDSLAPFEERVNVRAGENRKLEARLRVQKGIARIELGRAAEGADVTLVTDGQARRLDSFPKQVALGTEKRHQLVAKKKGYSDYRRDVTFDDGVPEKTFTIEMVEIGKAPPPDAKGVAAKDPDGKVDPNKPSDESAADAMGTLNINSLPPSNVILNGRPLGSTPKMGVKVKAGPVTVVFVHAEHGRKVQSTVVPPGGTATVLVRFP